MQGFSSRGARGITGGARGGRTYHKSTCKYLRCAVNRLRLRDREVTDGAQTMEGNIKKFENHGFNVM